ncbi:RNA methyltransferase [Pseudoroseicyclus sp. CXY001]|uniref:RNA methyltransferase n=1 Tax=Pseudoroseicyclus sp. CXY001 TaxID=3242492 RepID=UPI00358DBA0B
MSDIPFLPPAFVLVRPQMGENIGAAARGMLNFGLETLRLVAPRDGWPNPAAGAMASGAGRLLDAAGVFDDTAGALADCTRVYATTARPRGLTKRVVSPEQAMREAHAAALKGERAAVIFGPERAGLENEDIARAEAIVSIPVNPDFASLNLSQAVNLLAYEWRRAALAPEAERLELAGAVPAPGIELEKLAEHWEERLEEAQYFFPPDKAPGMKIVLRNFLSRAGMTRADVQMLHGVMRAMVRWKERG